MNKKSFTQRREKRLQKHRQQRKQFILEIPEQKNERKTFKYNETNTLIYFHPSLRAFHCWGWPSSILKNASIILCRSFFKRFVSLPISSILSPSPMRCLKMTIHSCLGCQKRGTAWNSFENIVKQRKVLKREEKHHQGEISLPKEFQLIMTKLREVTETLKHINFLNDRLIVFFSGPLFWLLAMLQLRLFTKTCQVFVSIFFVALPRIPSYAMAFLPLRRPFVAWIMEWNCFNEIPLGDWNKIQFDLFGEKQVEGFALVSRQLGSECLQRFVNDVKRSGNREIKKCLTSLTQQSHLGLMSSCIFTTRKKKQTIWRNTWRKRKPEM